ncbi:MAG: hypothetical protein DRP62_07090, partial [Planctomycetota bacterium]
MSNELYVWLSKLLDISLENVMFPNVILTVILPFLINFIAFYGLLDRLKIFGRRTSTNQTINLILASLISFFVIKLGFIGYAVASVGIAYLYIKNDLLRLGFILGMCLAYFVVVYYLV